MSFRRRLSADIEARIVTAIRAGQTHRQIASDNNIHQKTVQNVARRNDINLVCGRPRKHPRRMRVPVARTKPLGEAGQALAIEYLAFSERYAHSLWRKSFNLGLADRNHREDFISCGHEGLIKAAARWEGNGAFYKFCAAFIKGAVRKYITLEAKADGCAFENWRQTKLTRYMRRASKLPYFVTGLRETDAL